MLMRSLLKDPLLHFLVLGGALFAVFYWRGDAGEDGRARIRISAEQIVQLRQAATLLNGREPSEKELAALVEPAIRDEIMYREALALGLDVNDDEVRTRLIEKMRYLTEDLADPEPASEDELRAFFDASPERFLIPALVTFDQVYFSPRERGDALETDVAAALAVLTDGGDHAGLGDRTPLQGRFADAPREQVEILFGTALTEAVYTMEPDVWAGPFESDFGLHLVRLVSRSEARQPAFGEVRDAALQQYAEDRRNRANDANYAEIRARYEVIVDWPSSAAEEGL